MSFWDDFGSIITGVGVIATGLSGILSEDTNSPQPHTVGSVNFFTEVIDDKTYVTAQNTDPESRVILNFTNQVVSFDPTQGAILGTVSSQPVLDVSGSGAGACANVTEEIQDMLDGTLAMSAYPSPSSEGPIGTAIAYTLRAFGTATAINMVQGVTASFDKTQDGKYQFSIKSAGPTLTSADVSVRAPDGTKAKWSMNFTPQAATGSFATVEVPPGVNIFDKVAELDVNLEVASFSAESLFEELRKNTRRPPKARASA